ncbi:hypothetical protein [Mycobacteroides chelonae]|uniref:Uncharacterized protein n=1 Tax=Mycobacteroides chelonae TaxID=1774 RepID=A0A1S1M0F9_MYCCH|nr:hypothetical protein [Mycobacteroides chelonae]OHU76043.1 hypothetical protein BKG84_24415 [Mycobacteroides chelonae]
MFTAPLTATEYEGVVQRRYTLPRTPGWVLRDADHRLRGWHWLDRADEHWSSPDAAYRAFVPDTKRRYYLTKYGWSVERVENSEPYLLELLRITRGDSVPEIPSPPEGQEDVFDLLTETDSSAEEPHHADQ